MGIVSLDTAFHIGDWLALCLAAQSLWRAQNYFGELYPRWKARLGTPKAITAMAHKLTRILWHLFKYKIPFSPKIFRKEEEKNAPQEARPSPKHRRRPRLSPR